MIFGFVLLMATALYSLALGFLLILAIVLSPLVSLADGRVLNRLGYDKSRKKCFWDSMKINLLMLLSGFLLLFIPQELHRFVSRYWNTYPEALKLLVFFLGLLLPFLLFLLFTAIEIRLIQFMNPAFPRPLIRKSMLLRYGLKAMYLLVFIIAIVWLNY
jgi:hypothetical protein